MKLVSVVGARPQFVKLSPVDHAAVAYGIEHQIIHTGQHYDKNMSEGFFVSLGIQPPRHNLGIGSLSHGAQTGRMLESLEKLLLEDRPDGVVIYGDTNSTVAAALAAVKIYIPVFHLEAGLRSFNRRMPEEHNRIIADHCSDLCLAPTELAIDNLHKEGLGPKSVMVGDVMADVCLSTAREAPELSSLGLGPIEANSYHLATIHRAENTDDPKRLRSIITELASLSAPVILAAHPRLVAKAKSAGIELEQGVIRLAEPLSYPKMVAAVGSAKCVVTDSGGLQKECFLLRVPCVTVRSETEWRETVDLGWNALCDPSDLRATVEALRPTQTDATPYGDGRAAEAVIEEIAGFLQRNG